ncbi:MAG: hypothetical protein IPP47_21470 [Bryobacterales bacterium]|nr:hypothetical protein [Bryobacterales bacterium]
MADAVVVSPREVMISEGAGYTTVVVWKPGSPRAPNVRVVEDYVHHLRPPASASARPSKRKT